MRRTITLGVVTGLTAAIGRWPIACYGKGGDLANPVPHSLLWERWEYGRPGHPLALSLRWPTSCVGFQ